MPPKVTVVVLIWYTPSKHMTSKSSLPIGDRPGTSWQGWFCKLRSVSHVESVICNVSVLVPEPSEHWPLEKVRSSQGDTYNVKLEKKHTDGDWQLDMFGSPSDTRDSTPWSCQIDPPTYLDAVFNHSDSKYMLVLITTCSPTSVMWLLPSLPLCSSR